MFLWYLNFKLQTCIPCRFSFQQVSTSAVLSRFRSIIHPSTPMCSYYLSMHVYLCYESTNPVLLIIKIIENPTNHASSHYLYTVH